MVFSLCFSERIRHVARAIVVSSSCFIAALCATWPLALYLTTAVPLGTENEATIPLFSLWNLWWTADRMVHGFAGYWNAPFFYPNQGVLTYSEPMPLLGLLSTPLWLADAPPPIIYNVILLAVLTLNGIFAFRVGRALDADPLAAGIGAILMVTLPYVANVGGVLPNVTLFGMLWTLEGLIRFGYTSATRWSIWAALGFVATYFLFQQYALFFAPFATVGGLVALARQHWQRTCILRLGWPSLLASVLVLVIAWPALNVHAAQGFERREQVVRALSARPSDLLTRPVTALIPIPPRSPADTGGLFPGIFIITLALEAAITGWLTFKQRS